MFLAMQQFCARSTIYLLSPCWWILLMLFEWPLLTSCRVMSHSWLMCPIVNFVLGWNILWVRSKCHFHRLAIMRFCFVSPTACDITTSRACKLYVGCGYELNIFGEELCNIESSIGLVLEREFCPTKGSFDIFGWGLSIPRHVIPSPAFILCDNNIVLSISWSWATYVTSWLYCTMNPSSPCYKIRWL